MSEKELNLSDPELRFLVQRVIFGEANPDEEDLVFKAVEMDPKVAKIYDQALLESQLLEKGCERLRSRWDQEEADRRKQQNESYLKESLFQKLVVSRLQSLVDWVAGWKIFKKRKSPYDDLYEYYPPELEDEIEREEALERQDPKDRLQPRRRRGEGTKEKDELHKQ